MPDLCDLLTRFLAAHAHADVFEAAVDSTFVDGDVQPMLLVTAFALRAGDDVAAARTRAGARDDGLWYDVLDTVCELPLEMPLHAFYPAWPDGLDAGDRRLLAQLRAAATSTDGFASARKLFVFRHAGGWPIRDVVADAPL